MDGVSAAPRGRGERGATWTGSEAGLVRSEEGGAECGRRVVPGGKLGGGGECADGVAMMM